MILVVGATGNLGGAIARTLIGRGEVVRVLVRNPSSGSELVEAGAQPVVGDLKEPDSLRVACEGVDALVTTANAVGRGGADSIDAVDVHGNEHLVAAAAAEHVGHFVFTSALGASPESPVPFLRAKGATEQRLEDSDLTWTILQPNLFMDTWLPMAIGGPALAGQPVTLVGEGRRRHSMVAMADVVSYAVAALGRAEARNQRIVVGGPEPVSWRDAIAAFERELGREIPVRTIPLGEPVPGMPPEVNGLFQALETYDSPLDMAATAATYGVTPTPIAEFVHRFVSTAHR
jgi:NADH dehydrogenase